MLHCKYYNTIIDGDSTYCSSIRCGKRVERAKNIGEVHCKHCGAKIDNDSLYCRECGGLVERIKREYVHYDEHKITYMTVKEVLNAENSDRLESAKIAQTKQESRRPELTLPEIGSAQETSPRKAEHHKKIQTGKNLQPRRIKKKEPVKKTGAIKKEKEPYELHHRTYIELHRDSNARRSDNILDKYCWIVIACIIVLILYINSI